jgi:type I restriction enzyme M protein
VERLGTEATAVNPALQAFENGMADAHAPVASLSKSAKGIAAVPAAPKQALLAALTEQTDATHAYMADRAALANGLAAFCKSISKPPATNTAQHKARQTFDPLAESARGLVKQVDLLYKLAARSGQLAQELTSHEAAAEFFDRRATSKLIKQLDEQRKAAVEQLKDCAYLHRQVTWLQDRFPQAEMQDVLGMCKVVTRAEIEAADWSLTPGRFVGVAPAEVDEDFDFEQTLRDIHVELADLNRESVDLAVKIQTSFEELGV